jgi:hypothetical protein
LLANLESVGQVFEVYVPSIQHVVTVLPAINGELVADAASAPVVDGQRTAKLDFKAAVNNQYCTTGFSNVNNQRDPADLNLTTIPLTSYCQEPQSSQKLVRGARNEQCPNNATLRAASAAGCGLIFDPNTEANGTAFSLGTDGSTGTVGETAGNDSTGAASNSDVATYDPLTGLALLPNGDALILGNVLAPPKTWQDLLSFPITGGQK